MTTITTTARKNAQEFLKKETQFQLGFLPTEQSNPKTKHLDKIFEENINDGIKMLQSIDRDITQMARKIFSEEPFQDFTSSLTNAVKNGNRIAFSGCGATGRLSIILERCWRDFWNKEAPTSKISKQVISIMTGGDYALVKSVECFEDYSEFGRQQVREAGLGSGDVLVAITEGGETSSVLGTVNQALANGCEVFLLFNNPADILCQHIERSRIAIEDPRVTILDLYCGPMALAGSTRMQATTAELLIAGTALEQACEALLSSNISGTHASESVATYETLLTALESDKCVAKMNQWITIEENLYKQEGLVTYYADELMLDIFTDTTERSPTFTLPPFTQKDDNTSPLAWAFVKNPLLDTPTAWRRVFADRQPNCLEWTPEQYRKMNAPDSLVSNPPPISRKNLYSFMIGNEDCPARRNKSNACMLIELYEESLSSSFDSIAQTFDNSYKISIGKGGTGDIVFPIKIPASPLGIWYRLTTKLILNTISTAVMVRLGRVRGNWMSCVQATNKKLVDRSIRLIAELTDLSYSDACLLFFQANEEMAVQAEQTQKKMPVVEYALTDSMRQLKLSKE